MAFVYDAPTFLNMIEFLAGLLIVGAVIKQTKMPEKLTMGGILILISGLIILLKQFYVLFYGFLAMPAELFNALIFLCFAIGLLNYTHRFRRGKKQVL